MSNIEYVYKNLNDPNKQIFMVDPNTRPDVYWGEHVNEIKKILKTPTFDNQFGYSANEESQKEFWNYTMNFADSKSGLWLEFGTYKGRSINVISTRTELTVYGFDSFEGLPEDWYSDINFCKKGALNLNGILPKVNPNVHLIAGWYENTVPEFVKQLPSDVDKISFMHIDCDLYSSTKTVFDNLKHLIKPGTVIMFDEYWYNYRWEEHEYKAFQELAKECNLNYKYIANTPRGLVSLKIV
jgi:hypothetical protein